MAMGIFLFIAVASTSAFASYNYCTASTNIIDYEWVSSVSLNGGQIVSSNSKYSDFTGSLLTTLNIGSQYTLYVDVNTTWNYNEYLKAWIDFNNDGNFSNDEEINFKNVTFSGSHTFSKTFTVPNNSVPSETRMRVYLRYASASSACKKSNAGEVEDYNIRLSTAQACTDGLSVSCGSGNCLGTMFCSSGVWGVCSVECYGLGSDCQNKCVDNFSYSTGNCDLAACSCHYSTVENCDLKDGCYDYQSGCEERDYSCQESGCNYASNNMNTDFYDAFFNYCSADTIRTKRAFHDFSCDGICKDYVSFTDDSLVQDCNYFDGWYNTTETSWNNLTQYTEKENIQQEYRDYTCSLVPVTSCKYDAGDTRWIETGRIRTKSSIKYCRASITNSCSFLEYISRVSLNGNDKNSGSSVYSNFTNVTFASLNSGMQYTLYVDVKINATYSEYIKAWIDFNNDGNFSNDEEINLGSAKFSRNRTFSKNFTVPSNSTLAETRMRVFLKWNGYPTPCENAAFGEIEDYSIKIL
jgi:hypothetical protein